MFSLGWHKRRLSSCFGAIVDFVSVATSIEISDICMDLWRDLWQMLPLGDIGWCQESLGRCGARSSPTPP